MNSVVGIIGCGNIGIAVAQMLSGFKMSNLLYTSRRTKPESNNYDKITWLTILYGSLHVFHYIFVYSISGTSWRTTGSRRRFSQTKRFYYSDGGPGPGDQIHHQQRSIEPDETERRDN